MKDIIIFTQNTMASIVATREVLKNNHERIKTIVLASQLKGESFKEQLKVAHKLIKKSSLNFFTYKLIESKLYPILLSSHKILNTKKYKETKTIEDLAKEHNVPIINCGNLSNENFLYQIKELNPKYILCLVSQILQKPVFEILGNKLINAHGSFLPEYRGAAQYVWYILNNDSQFGVTIHYMEPGLDTGSIIHQKKFDYDKSKSMYKLHYDISLAFGKMFNEFLNLKNFNAVKQDDSKATFTRLPLKKDMKQLKEKGYKIITIKDFLKYL